MSPDRDWRMRAEDILSSIERIQEYTRGLTFEQFCADQRTVDAVLRNLEVIGEAASRIPLEIQEAHSDLPWFEMRGMRNIVAHEYFGVSLSIVWRAMEQDLPILVDGVRSLLAP